MGRREPAAAVCERLNFNSATPENSVSPSVAVASASYARARMHDVHEPRKSSPPGSAHTDTCTRVTWIYVFLSFMLHRRTCATRNSLPPLGSLSPTESSYARNATLNFDGDAGGSFLYELFSDSFISRIFPFTACVRERSAEVRNVRNAPLNFDSDEGSRFLLELFSDFLFFPGFLYGPRTWMLAGGWEYEKR